MTHQDAPSPAHAHAYELVMPFVVCESKGGPYPDTAFAAAYSCAVIDETLRALAAQLQNGLTAATVTRYVPPALVPQLNLVAMQHGFVLTHAPWDERPDEWTLATFTLPSAS